ncbi:MAG: MBOAT family O-acyltransferase [Candidatus Korobacteraceae bacterium]
MLFDSPIFFVFLILVVVGYWRLKFRAQNIFLLLASYFFYGWWDWRFLLLMIGSTTVDYFIAHAIGRAPDDFRRKRLLILSLVINFGILGIFKYFNFFIGSFSHLVSTIGFAHLPVSFLKIILPPGISFYTFQEVAYIVDVYNRKIEPADSFIDYALFISLFPHLIAGPIQRPDHLLPQVQKHRFWDGEKALDGMLLIAEGLFRKCVIADNCALIANAAFGGKFGPPNLPVLLLGTYAFAWQIYGDFSGYSDIARGCAQILGFHFMVNFRQPYFAQNLQDFWRRWHISLSTWLRDYLYIRIGGNRKGEARTYSNLLTTMLLGGLWHGANWTFVIWGGIHGAGLAFERLIGITKERLSNRMALIWLRRILVFHLVCFSWIFFRAESVSAAWQMIGGLAHWNWQPSYWAAAKFLTVFSLPLFILDLSLEATGDEYLFQSRPHFQRVGVALTSILAIVLFGANQANAFIYFQF